MAKSKYNYKIKDKKDVSVIGANRVSIRITLQEEYNKEQIQEIIYEVIDKFKRYKYNLPNIVYPHPSRSDIIWVYVALSEEKFKYDDFICWSQWYRTDIDSRYIPARIDGDIVRINEPVTNKGKDILEIKWNGEVY